MNLKVAQCPGCGGDLRVKDVSDSAHCIYCGATIVIERSRPLVSVSDDSVAKKSRALKVGSIQAGKANELSKCLDW